MIKSGRSFRFGPHVKSYNHLQGWQAVCRKSEDGTQMLVVLHSFENCGECVTVDLPADEAEGWKLSEVFGRENLQVDVQNNQLSVQGLEEYDGVVGLLTC